MYEYETLCVVILIPVAVHLLRLQCWCGWTDIERKDMAIICAQIAQAAAHLHKYHVVHLDLKCDNFLVDPASGVCLFK